jgi:hypothetical protein
MNDASRQNVTITRIVDGWSVTLDGEEPTVLDEELGARLGFARPRKIRELIERMVSDGILNDSDIRPTVGRVATGVASTVVTKYRLTETGTLLVITRSDTKIAHAITRQVIEVFKAVRRGQPPVPQQVPVMSSSPLVGETHLRGEVPAWCAMAARAQGVSVHRIHGELRREFHVPGVYQLPVLLWPFARNLLESLAFGRRQLASRSLRRLAVVPGPAQHVLPFPGTQR